MSDITLRGLLGAIGGAVAWVLGAKSSIAITKSETTDPVGSLEKGKEKPRYFRCRVKAVESTRIGDSIRTCFAKECWEYSDDLIHWHEE